MSIESTFMGLTVCSPVVVGSCGLTADIDKLVQMEQAGAGTVVLKSVLEEQIVLDIKRNSRVVAATHAYGEAYNYLVKHNGDDLLKRQFELIAEAKKRLSIPVVGSINCVSFESWIDYAAKFAAAGCDALELCVNIMPYETSLSVDDVERSFSQIITALHRLVSIPVGIKVNPYFTDMAKQMQQLSWMYIDGLTLFNAPAVVDIDVESETFCMPSPEVSPSALYNTLRWTAVLSNKVRCGISASSGVGQPMDVVKLLLSGAKTVQVVSSLYRNGINYISTLNDGLRQWMQAKHYDRVNQFCGKMAVRDGEKISEKMRLWYMKNYAEIG